MARGDALCAPKAPVLALLLVVSAAAAAATLASVAIVLAARPGSRRRIGRA